MVRVAVPQTLTRERVRPSEGRRTRLSGPTMGVTWRVDAIAPRSVSDAQIAAAAQAAVDLVVAQMSTWEPQSDLSRFNCADAGWHEVPPELLSVAEAGLDIARRSGGAFDPTLGVLVDLWGFGPPGGRSSPPDPGALAAARAGFGSLELDVAERRLHQPGGLTLDLSGIAKGFGVDQVGRALEALGLSAFLLEVGGELLGAGVKPSGEPWFVAVERPPEAGEELEPIVVALADLSIASSGDWRRRFEVQGRAYSHTLDPHTRAPIDNGVAAVTVLHPTCMQADAWCTALAVLGPEQGLAMAEAEGLAALFLLRQGQGWRELMSSAFAELLE
jgi:FAD:protein FMN transferase